jgi:hypothetical protein
MKKHMYIVLALLFVLMINVLPAYADHGGHGRHGGGHVGIGLYFGPGLWWPYSYYPYYPYYSYPYYPPSRVIIEQPSEMYVQPAPQAEAPRYWYYCQEPQGYYPYVKKCPKGWMKVVPPENPPEGKE